MGQGHLVPSRLDWLVSTDPGCGWFAQMPLLFQTHGLVDRHGHGHQHALKALLNYQFHRPINNSVTLIVAGHPHLLYQANFDVLKSTRAYELATGWAQREMPSALMSA